jgi:CTP synthase (UTP-ammonia lyase)
MWTEWCIIASFYQILIHFHTIIKFLGVQAIYQLPKELWSQHIREIVLKLVKISEFYFLNLNLLALIMVNPIIFLFLFSN